MFDYARGVEDLERRQIRMIGDPEKRYREDPVRMLRAVRFAAKLDFDIEPATAAPIPELAHLLEAIPAARLFDEFLKLFMAGNALRTFTLEKLLEYDLLDHLFPANALEALEEQPRALALIEAAMRSTDERIAQDKPVTPAFIFAALLWPPTIELKHRMEDTRRPSPLPAMQERGPVHHLGAGASHRHPRRFSQPMREIWEFQLRLQKRRGKQVNSELVAHRRFRAAYDFLLLREESGEDLEGLGAFWTELQEDLPRLHPLASRKRNSRGGSAAPAQAQAAASAQAMTTSYVALGSNLGESREQVAAALEALEDCPTRTASPRAHPGTAARRWGPAASRTISTRWHASAPTWRP